MNRLLSRIAGLFFGAILLCSTPAWGGDAGQDLFQRGSEAYRAGDFEIAADSFAAQSRLHPSTGAFLNLGNTEWQRGRVGHAVLAWERSAWIDPFNKVAKANLEFARKSAQLEVPYLAWYEVASSWLPASWWAWLAGLSLWTAVGAAMLPPILRIRKSSWHQALAATGLALFLLSLPAHLGVASRTALGFTLERDTPLRLTPTKQGQVLTIMTAGEPGRVKKQRGDFVYIQGLRSRGWVDRSAFATVVSRRTQ